MRARCSAVWVCGALGLLTVVQAVRYTPDWKSLDARPIPGWYDEAKVGIFIHWGVFSVPSYVSEWFVQLWEQEKNSKVVDFMRNNYRPDFNYADFAPDLTAEFFDATQWANIFQAAGANYVVFVSKHCEGYTNWPSNTSFNWNSMDVGPKRDIVGELEAAVRGQTDMHFGLYHCLYEWVNPLYLRDKANNFNTRDFVQTKTLPAMYELVNTYKPDLLFSDGDWEAPDEYWGSKHFLTWLFNDSPVKDKIVVNDRWGINCSCQHGGYWDCGDRFNPGVLMQHKWEQAMTLDRQSWGFRRDVTLDQILSIQELLALVARTISCGGNILINVGPTKEGMISPVYEERLRQLGAWLKVNGEAIYATRTWTMQNDTLNPDVWYTAKDTPSGHVVYAILLQWPGEPTLKLAAPRTSEQSNITLVGYQGAPFTFQNTESGLEIDVPQIPFNQMPCQWAWVLRMERLAN